MAIFNPAVPQTQDPNFMGYSKAIDAPAPNTSVGQLIKSVGEGITGAVNIADEWVKKNIDTDVKAKVDTERDIYTANLEATRATQQKGLIPNPNPYTQDLLAFNGDPQDVPGGLQSGLDRVDQLGTAKAAGGSKINDTLYTANLNSVAKNLRAQYPGYRDYIDQRISAVSGMDPANAYYKNLMQDINYSANKTDSLQKHTENLIYSNINLPGAPQILQTYQAAKAQGKDISIEVASWVNQYKGAEYGEEAAKRKREADKGNVEDLKTTYTQDFTKVAGSRAQAGIDTIQIGLGTQTTQGVVDFMATAAKPGITIDPVLLQQAATGIGATKTQVALDLYKKAKALDGSGRSFESVMGSQAIQQEVENQTKPYDIALKAIQDKEFGTATMALRQATAVKNGAVRDLLTDKTVGKQMKKIAAFQDIAPNYSEIGQRALLQAGVAEDIKSYFVEKGLDAMSGGIDPLKQPSLAADLADANDKKIAGSTGVRNELVRLPLRMTDPDAPDAVKIKLARYAFDPQYNFDALSNIKMDYTDPRTNRPVAGKYAAYGILTSPAITDTMAKLRSSSPEGEKAWQDYKTWSERSFGQLFREDVQSLNKIQKDAANSKNPIHVSWDSDNLRWGLVDGQGKEVRGGAYGMALPGMSQDQNFVNQATVMINRLNSGLSNLSQVQKKEGGDTNAYMLRTLQTVGLDVDASTTGLPAQMMEAVKKAHEKPMPFNERFFGK